MSDETQRSSNAPEEGKKDPSTMEKVSHEVDKSVHSEDEPLGKRAPGTPFALVALTYLGILAALAVIGSLIYFAL